MKKTSKQNVSCYKLPEESKQLFLRKFRKEALRGFRGGVSAEELIAAVREALVDEVHRE